MGKYANYSKYMPKDRAPTPADIATAIVKAREEAVRTSVDKMAENYRKGMVELRRTSPELMATRLATWLGLFFTRNVGAQYADVMNEVRKEYKRIRPKAPAKIELGAL